MIVEALMIPIQQLTFFNEIINKGQKIHGQNKKKFVKVYNYTGYKINDIKL